MRLKKRAKVVTSAKWVGDLGDAQRSLSQQEGSLHQQHLVDIINDGAAI